MGAQQGQHLHRLAQAHVVGEHAAETELAQEVEPAEPLALVAAQRAAEAARLLLRLDALERAQLLAQLGEGLVDRRRRHLDQQRVDQHRLRGQEAQPVVALVVGQLGERVVGLAPGRRQQAARAVRQGNEAVPLGDRLEDPLEVDLAALELHPAGKLEPVDAAVDAQLRRARGAHRGAVDLDRPALAQQRLGDRRDLLRAQLQLMAAATGDRLHGGLEKT